VRRQYLDGEPPGWPPIFGPTSIGEAELKRVLAKTLDQRRRASAYIAEGLNIAAESLTRDLIEQAHLCEEWVADYTRNNCALSLLTTDPRPLPDHVCWAAQDATVERWQEQHGRRLPFDLAEQQALRLVVERQTPNGTVTLFGPVKQARKLPRIVGCGQPLEFFEDELPTPYTHEWRWDHPVLLSDPNQAPPALRLTTERLEAWYGQTLYGRPKFVGPALGSTHAEPTEAEKQAYGRTATAGRGPLTIARLMWGELDGREITEQWVHYWQTRPKGSPVFKRPPRAPRRNRKKSLNQ
jgi:hypothetical protein